MITQILLRHNFNIPHHGALLTSSKIKLCKKFTNYSSAEKDKSPRPGMVA